MKRFQPIIISFNSIEQKIPRYFYPASIQFIQKLNFPDLKTQVPIVSGQWDFKANLPFKLEGWKNSEDLSKCDKDKLEKEVV
ncbi:hypothetical protein ACTS94_02915 [Empedobacter falsenii]